MSPAALTLCIRLIFGKRGQHHYFQHNATPCQELTCPQKRCIYIGSDVDKQIIQLTSISFRKTMVTGKIGRHSLEIGLQ